MELFFRIHLILFMVMPITVIINLQLQMTSAAIGVNYGFKGDNLPSANDVIELYKKENIPLLRMLEPNTDVLNALRGSKIKVSLGVKNDDVSNIAMNVNTATQWVYDNVVPYIKDVDIEWIVLGNEMVPSPEAKFIPQAMNNILSGLNTANIVNIKISTAVNAAKVLGVASPPSAASFSNDASADMQGIITWLAGTNNPLLINVHPYYVFALNPYNITLDYALFSAKQPIVDGVTQYYSLFEAMVDAIYAASDRFGGSNVALVVSETGWPTAGNEPYTNKQNAHVFNQKLINKLKMTGTPRKPSTVLDIFISSMFNENLKAVGVEQNWGLHYANKEPVYPLTF